MDLDEYIERKNHRHLVWGAILFALFFGGLVSVLGLSLAIVWVSPILGSFLSYWLVQHWAGKPLRWLKKQAYAGTQGIYHAFDDLQVRVRWNGGACEVVADDVLNVMGIAAEERPKTLRRLALRYPGGLFRDIDNEWWFSEPAVLDWLAGQAQNLDLRALRFRQWLERETFPPLRKKAEQGPV